MNHYRTYRESDIQILQFIQRARALGFSLKDIASLLGLYRDTKRGAEFQFIKCAKAWRLHGNISPWNTVSKCHR